MPKKVFVVKCREMDDFSGTFSIEESNYYELSDEDYELLRSNLWRLSHRTSDYVQYKIVEYVEQPVVITDLIGYIKEQLRAEEEVREARRKQAEARKKKNKAEELERKRKQLAKLKQELGEA